MTAALRRLADPEHPAAEAAMRRVFASLHVPDGPFRPEVEARMLQLPDAGLVLPAAQLAAVVAALRAHDITTRAYLGEFWWSWDTPPVIEAWHALDLAEPAGYLDGGQWVAGSHEHVLVGADGTWGSIAADGESLLVGGPAWLVRALRAVTGAGREDDDVRDWLAIWREDVERGAPGWWQPALLAHLYGADRAAALTRAAGWSA